MTVLEPAGNVTFLIVLSCLETLVFRDTAGYSRNVSRIVCGIIGVQLEYSSAEVAQSLVANDDTSVRPISRSNHQLCSEVYYLND